MSAKGLPQNSGFTPATSASLVRDIAGFDRESAFARSDDIHAGNQDRFVPSSERGLKPALPRVRPVPGAEQKNGAADFVRRQIIPQQLGMRQPEVTRIGRGRFDERASPLVTFIRRKVKAKRGVVLQKAPRCDTAQV